MRRAVLAVVLAPAIVWLTWCGGKTGDGTDDSGISSCTYYVSDLETMCEESDSASVLDRCHHVLDDLVDGGLDAEIVPHRCTAGGGGCCAYAMDSGPWTVCYYGDAFPPALVEGFCNGSDASYVAP